MRRWTGKNPAFRSWFGFHFGKRWFCFGPGWWKKMENTP